MERYKAERRRGTRKQSHVWAWEDHHGRDVPDGLVVHHIDGDRKNNDPANLLACTQEHHMRIHAGWDPREDGWWWPCVDCKLLFPEGERGMRSVCRICGNARMRSYLLTEADENREKRLQWHREHYQRHREKRLLYASRQRERIKRSRKIRTLLIFSALSAASTHARGTESARAACRSLP